jgi:hypothetical protein
LFEHFCLIIIYHFVRKIFLKTIIVFEIPVMFIVKELPVDIYIIYSSHIYFSMQLKLRGKNLNTDYRTLKYNLVLDSNRIYLD